MKLSRNAPCPCGSGRKVKLCCGTAQERERELRRLASALAEIAELPHVFPELRPRGTRFDRWADEVARELPDGAVARAALVQQGADLLGDEEEARIVAAYSSRYTEEWQQLCDELGGEEVAAGALVDAAVSAALAERGPVDRRLVDLLEAEPELAPARVLALACEPSDLWSFADALAATAYADSRRFLDDARPLATEAHVERLRSLVDHVRRQLPIGGAPGATRALAAACAADEETLREAALLLLMQAAAEVLTAA